MGAGRHSRTTTPACGSVAWYGATARLACAQAAKRGPWQFFAVTQMAITALDYNPATRWSKQNLETIRARRRTDATIAKHLRILEGLAKAHDGVLPAYKWLNEHGYFHSYNIMREYPQAFAHIKTSEHKKYEAYQAQTKTKAEGVATVGQILAPAKVKTLAAYDVPGAEFNPTALHIEAGTPEADWLQIGRALASVCQSAYWWTGDWMIYGFNTYGKKTTFDLAQQATGYTRHVLYACASTARRFPPERRVEALTFYHHKMVSKFTPAVADKVLAEAAEIGLTGRQVLEAAQQVAGEVKPKPHHPLQLTKVTIRLYGPTYDKLKARCPAGRPVDAMISQIIEEWLLGKPMQRSETNGKKTTQWKAELGAL
jgi:hypothetical protein